MEKVTVIFRKDQDGIITAFLPEMRCNHGMIVCYQHIGQHSEASISYYDSTTKATKEEYIPLLKELEGIYSDCKLTVKQRLPKGGNSKAWY